MWERAELKDNAKAALKRFYWLAFVVCLIFGALRTFSSIFLDASTYIDLFNQIGRNNLFQETARIFDSFSTISFVLYIAAIFLVVNPLTVGLNRYFMESRSFRSDISMLFYGFTGGRYWNIVKVMLICDVKILLWSLLLVIPGLVKSYQYYFVPYLLAENADMPASRYFEISKGMTNDEKLNIFVLELSFFGWVMLTLITCGIGMMFLNPYMYATYAECYALMRAKAFAYNLATPAELPDFYPPQPLQ